MNYQLIIVVVAAVVSVVYVVRHMINDWRHTRRTGCSSCPASKKPPSR